MKTFTYGLYVGLVMLVINLAVSMLFSLLIPAVPHEYSNMAIFRSWSDPVMSLFFVYPFAVGMIISAIWNHAKKIVVGKNVHQKGFNYGLSLWLLLTIPGMIITYATFQVSLTLVGIWTVSGLLSFLAAGWLLSRLHGMLVE